MRHFLKFIPVDKRAQAEREYAATPEAVVAPAPTSERAPQPAANRRVKPDPLPSARPAERAAGPPVQDVRVEARGIKAKLEASAAIDNTSAYLAALDNSALMLADSGIFKQDAPEQARERSYNPYNRGK